MKSALFVSAAGLCLFAAESPFAYGQTKPPPAPLDEQDLEGVWVAERHFGLDLSGPLTITPLHGLWVARLRGETIPVDRIITEDGSIMWKFSFFEEGFFEGHQSEPEGDIVGHWYQPPGPVLEYRFATPVQLSARPGGSYTGSLRPVHDTASMSIPLKLAETQERGGEAVYNAFLRNPERNFGHYWIEIHSARVSDDAIDFIGYDGSVIATGNLNEDRDGFSMYVERFGETMDFTRRSRPQATGFFPRRTSSFFTKMPRPVELDDGWQTASPEETDLDPAALANLVKTISNLTPTGVQDPYVHSLLIAHRGKLVMEEYFHGFHRDIPHDSRSAGKSVASALAGIALQNGVIESLDRPVYPVFGGVEAFANPDERKRDLSLRHLLTMSSGLDCNDSDPDSLGQENLVQSQSDEPDLDKYVLSLPMVSEAGGTTAYCSASINLAVGVIQEAAGQTIPRFFEEHFAQPLDIDYYQMNLARSYDGYWGGGIRLTPRDFLKLGQLYLEGGTWNGRRIIPEDYVQESWKPQASIGEEGNYGLAWWRATTNAGDRTIEAFMADGNGGQRLYVIPELELVVMLNAGNYSNVRGINTFSRDFMRDVVIPAAIRAQQASGG